MRKIFEETNIKNMKLKNRIFRAALGDRHAVDGHYGHEDLKVYEQIAKGGVGTIITGYSYVSGYPCKTGMLGMFDDSFIDEYKELTGLVHTHGANIVMQLVYCGSYVLDDIGDNITFAPSAVENLNSHLVPKEITREEILTIENDFAKAACRAKMAGFDGIEIHAAHGFLHSQFLTPYYNRRTDEYGGSDENRARFLEETIESVRMEVGDDFPIFVKINCTDEMEDGITHEGFIKACKMSEQAGADAIDVSGAWHKFREPAFFRKAAEHATEVCDIPIILTGGIKNRETVEQLLVETDIDYFAIGRAFMTNANFLNEW